HRFEEINPFDMDSTPIVHKTSPFSIDPEINAKITMWIGEVWRLDTAAIVYANNSSLSERNGVAQYIFGLGGPEIPNEISQAGGECRIGEVLMTSGGNLKTRYVVHTCCPTFNQKYLSASENALNSCYRAALGLSSEHNLSTMAFSCIHTSSRQFPSELGTHVALRTIRRHLEKHGQHLKNVILCLESEIDIESYKKLMPLYFPRTEAELQLAQRTLPKDCGNKFGEKEIEERRLRAQDTKKEDPDIIKKKKIENRTVEQVEQERIQSMYEDCLDRSRTTDLSNIARLNFIYQVASSDGSPIVVVIGSHMDPSRDDLDSVLLYFIRIFEGLAQREFSIMYFHSNMSSVPLPEMAWLKKLLLIVEHKYSKQLTDLHVIHPTFFFKATFKVLRGFLLYDRFPTRIVYHNNLNKFKDIVGRLNLPKSVFSYEFKYNDVVEYSVESHEG
ncbi:hypothetical protein SAMD00019534_095570, partial [Acytostelium subglobosum LB1]|uniref:hypothetical protein n=1 Tax=Acytostelium subglobosum LB1 TaxID=1410327 RepID=UPI000644A3B6